MSRRRKRQQSKRRTAPAARQPRREWLGGRLRFPGVVMEPEPFRPEVVLWLELPDDLILGATFAEPGGPPLSFADTLLDAMAEPAAGPPRRPGRVRVASADLANEVRRAVPGVEVVVEPTPELDRVLAMMAEHGLGGTNVAPSYLEHGRIEPERVAEMFRAAAALFGIAPWRTADDDQVLRVDIPALGIEGACLSIIGGLGENHGLILFPSHAAYASFLAATEAMQGPPGAGEALDLGTSTLALHFDPASALPDSMRREAMEHGWTVAGPDAYPTVQHRDRDGVLLLGEERDLQVISACARAITAFWVKHGPLFERERFEPVCESWLDEDDLEVRLTAPYEAAELFEVNAPTPAPRPSLRPDPRPRTAGPAPKVGRNDPCPCGSGRKYKKCCMHKDQAAAREGRKPVRLHEVDVRLVERMMDFAERRFGETWLDAVDKVDPAGCINLFGPWSVYHVEIDRRPVAEWFLEANRSRLSGAEAAWVEAQRVAWLSVWQVQDAEPGQSVSLRDLLTGEERTVTESSASHTLRVRDAILARIVDHEGLSLLCGVHSVPLPPRDAAEVVRRTRGRLRRKREVPPERLRGGDITGYLIRRWEEAIDALDARAAEPPELRNTDDEAFLFTVDHFRFDPTAEREVEARLAEMDGVETPEPDVKERNFLFTRPGNPKNPGWENTVLGHAHLEPGVLHVESNSVERADRLRARVEAACGDAIRHLVREHADPLASLGEGRSARPTADADLDLPPATATQLELDFKRDHYAEWVDSPIPALDGKTPREAVRSAAGREAVELLIEECEHMEARLPPGQRFDFSEVRRALGLQE